MSTSAEKDIQFLVTDGNDEQIVRLIYALLALDQKQVLQRVELLQQLGERYLTLGITLERIAGQDIEKAITCLDTGSLVIPTQRDPRALAWYNEAVRNIDAGIGQAPEAFDTSRAIRLVRLAHALYGEEERN